MLEPAYGRNVTSYTLHCPADADEISMTLTKGDELIYWGRSTDYERIWGNVTYNYPDMEPVIRRLETDREDDDPNPDSMTVTVGEGLLANSSWADVTFSLYDPAKDEVKPFCITVLPDL